MQTGWESRRTVSCWCNRDAEMAARAFVTHTVQPKQVFIPMHFARTNQLTLASFDRRSRQPGYKACAVNVHPLPQGEQDSR
jgi:predicted molibdopterin-dependent oxidoreductase YjgC